MFVPTWLIFLFSGTVMAILVLAWGIRNDQFDDQDRAKYLPLAGLPARELANPPTARRGVTYFTFLILLAVGPVVLLWTLATIARSS